MQELYTTLGKRIAMYRKQKNLSQEYLAELTNLHRNYIGNIERGEKHATIESLYKISKVLDIPLELLFKDF